ncbi:NDUFS5 [Phaffia rhodozyma]|uniref:NADH dehydrogenase [ubiquinone] iron-sulfur protein 5 n=1 Tax=Phaffia rhodozyma TaxID=264483 RepID=A0A0F7STB1_PHARH|nr:NDUFS5 [Phaffia rhodozyma]
MASGQSLKGGLTPCFVFWQDFTRCYAGTDNPKDCTLFREDYQECLHNKKEHARSEAIHAQYAKNLEKEGKSQKEIAQALKLGLAVSVGLIEGHGYEKEGSSESG